MRHITKQEGNNEYIWRGEGVSQGCGVFPAMDTMLVLVGGVGLPLFPDLYHQTLFLFPNPSECGEQPDSAGAYTTQIISFVQFAIVSSMSG